VRASVGADRVGGRQQFSSSQALDEAHVSLVAFGGAWDNAMVTGWSANPLGMLWRRGMRRSSRPVAMDVGPAGATALTDFDVRKERRERRHDDLRHAFDERDLHRCRIGAPADSYSRPKKRAISSMACCASLTSPPIPRKP
jgi:hypothetical protein